jgi:predicted TIM-barrel fold metal-dependent hydrolase
MTRFDSGSGCTRRRVVKALGFAAAGALTPRDFLTAQAPKRGKIDVHSHTYPPGQANGKAAAWKPETTIEAMEKYGISVSMLSAINGSRDPFYSGKPEAAAAVRANNEYHAKLVQQYPKRFGFFANVLLS